MLRPFFFRSFLNTCYNEFSYLVPIVKGVIGRKKGENMEQNINKLGAFVATLAQSNGVLITASGNTITFTFDPSTINTLTDVDAPSYTAEGNLPANSSAFNGHTVVAGGKLYHGGDDVP